ncbi:papain inhibitor-like [Daktulosphaira vitifoliae]|uniref:papain inhibitor-like n=1 Tax=Daktulosphaira vitifoliae TaxID=58002 RepID=UPI0021A9D315|nr:papain inhibitor-like [Daktulosphaira vitifoliae]
MVEISRRKCPYGKIYSCCEKTDYNLSYNRLQSRVLYGDLTYYDLGLTACGKVYKNSDLVAAVAFGHFRSLNPNLDSICGRRARIYNNKGRSVVVKIVDKCGGCKWGDIDVSRAAFRKLEPLSVGRTRVKWHYI